MRLFKCKMCNANMEVVEGDSVIKCGYCGTEQTLPSLYNDNVETFYQRADHLRKNFEYDSAKKIYETILMQNPEEAEAYWGILLCEFGIEYVSDEKTGLHIPTINRMQYQSVLSNMNYLSACQYADEGQRVLYERQAKDIERIQKGILAVVEKEEDYDIFICYKETDHERKTKDMVLANEIYHELTSAGYRVFFSRISLENKLGQEFEPYIFSALNSAKIMIAIGTKPEYFQSVWVKNEWSRFLHLIEKGEKKQLIPVYRDMDSFALPEEMHTLQAMNMDDISFMQDLLHGINKIIGGKKKEKDSQKIYIENNVATDMDYLLSKLKMYIERDRFELIDSCCEDILNQDAHNFEAYKYKLLALFQKKTLEEILEDLSNVNREEIVISLKDEYEGIIQELIDGYAKDSYLTIKIVKDIFSRYYPQAFCYMGYVIMLDPYFGDKYPKAHKLLEKMERFAKEQDIAISQKLRTVYEDIYQNNVLENEKRLQIAYKQCGNYINASLAEVNQYVNCFAIVNAKEQDYRRARHLVETMKEERDLDNAIEIFNRLGNYKESSFYRMNRNNIIQYYFEVCEDRKVYQVIGVSAVFIGMLILCYLVF